MNKLEEDIINEMNTSKRFSTEDYAQAATTVITKWIIKACEAQREVCARKYKVQHVDTVGTRGVYEDIKNAELPFRFFESNGIDYK